MLMYKASDMPKKEPPKSLREKLLMEAANERRIAKNFEGCSFVGEHPSRSHLEKASLLEQAALQIKEK